MAKNHIVERWQSERVKRRLKGRRVVLLAGSVGNASLETVKHYVQSQGEDMRRKASSRTPPA